MRYDRRRMPRFVPFVLGLAAVVAPAGDPPAERAVAVTFDDLPCNPQEGATAERQLAINRRIVETLVAKQIPAVGFVNEVRLQGSDVAALEVWTAAGLELGNHTWSHPSLHTTPLPDYLADIERGERATRALLDSRDRKLRWFRHPYLHTGLDLETKRAVEAFLAERGMRVAPVTFDNSEWVFARAYLAADEAADAEAEARIAEAYVAYMESKIDYFERQSRRLFGREIRQVLLVHANRLNADHFGKILAMLEQRGYRFVTLDAALADPAYATKDTFTGRAGISWLHRWALSGEEGRAAVVADEPRTPEWIRAAAGVEHE
jgi:peptidoglycan/xylan/chitin deacetylase (PgdA/CDA1 family)